jgi:hypothetical protein
MLVSDIFSINGTVAVPTRAVYLIKDSHGEAQQWKVVSDNLISRKSLSLLRMHSEHRSVVVCMQNRHLEHSLILPP